MIDPEIKLITIVGPTASGKTALAIDIAKEIGGEIICADSRTIYKHMDIGTAKPTPQEQAAVPHHVLDVVEPGERLSAAEFKRLAETAISEVWRRGHVPILVGGSGLYVDSVLYDYQFPPQPDPVRRAQLEAMELPQLITELERVDPEALAQIDTANRRRVVRAIETAGVGRNRLERVRPHTLVLGVLVNKIVAQQRITKRVEKMLSEGFIDEVKTIGERYGWDGEAMSVIGYRACRGVALGIESVEVGKQKFIAGDMALYKKQITWFKRNPDIHWVSNPAEAEELVRGFLRV